MLFELKRIINQALKSQAAGMKSVLASVVDLNGSSYRKPGVRMLITEAGETVGAVSGGCVEKEVVRQAQSVFVDGVPKIMTYDGRYRLGCEGVLFILIEPIVLSDEFVKSWSHLLQSRSAFEIFSYYRNDALADPNYGSVFRFGSLFLPIRENFRRSDDLREFRQQVKPALRLVIIGTEHDAVQMANIGAASGMEVVVVSSVKDARKPTDFPAADQVVALEPDAIDQLKLDDETAVILMTHSYSRDFQYALSVLEQSYCYFGIIGSEKRKLMLFDELLQFNPELDLDKLEGIFSPAGLNIGAITPQEIAMSVIAQIIAEVRQKETKLAVLSS